MGEEFAVKIMFALRFLIAVISVGAAILMLKYQTVADALRINALVGLVNPLIFMSISFTGIAYMASHTPIHKVMGVILGVLLIVWGTMK